ncbi:MAG: hypothetical protein HC927_04795 [Deltaproteobacteria bacterium]|nr:hypothetical protein [Deltaproteobacteria bacterium]
MPQLLKAGESAWAAALRNAWARRIIPLPGTGTPSELDSAVADEVAAMRELVVEAALAELTTAVNARSFFDAVGLDPADQQEFIERWLAWTGTLADFWQSIRDNLTDGTTKAPKFQFALQAAATVGYHPATLAALVAENVTSIAETAAWDFAGWDAMLVSNTVDPPDDVPGADATEKRQNYARVLERAVEDAYPTLTLRHRIAADESALTAPPSTTHLVDFLTDNADFDLLETNIDRWVADNPTAFAGTSDPEEARENLETVQRVYRLTPAWVATRRPRPCSSTGFARPATSPPIRATSSSRNSRSTSAAITTIPRRSPAGSGIAAPGLAAALRRWPRIWASRGPGPSSSRSWISANGTSRPPATG